MQKTEESCRFFVDYFCIRQCLNDFSVPHVLRAIKEIGLTVVELGTNWRSNDSPLFRMFCVLEIFGTAKARGALLVCGPALQEPAQVKDLLQVATDQDCSKELRGVADQVRSKLDKGVFFLAAVEGDKAALVAGVTSNLTDSLKAGDLLKYVTAQVGGKGGGRPDMAQGAASDISALPEAMESVYSWVEQNIG